MITINLPDTQRDEAVNAIDAALKAERIAIDFCTTWPTAKSVLEIIGKVPAAGLVVGIVVAIGDAYYKKKCSR